MNFFYIVAIIGIVIFLGTGTMVVMTLKQKIKNGFEFENENDLKHNVLWYSIGSIIILALLAGIFVAFHFADLHWIYIIAVELFLVFPATVFVACLGFPLQTLGVIYSIAYLKKSQRKALPTLWLILASLSWLAVLYVTVFCFKDFVHFIIF